MIKIYRINTNDIQLYSQDPQLSEREHIPISRLRAMSYSVNPRANPNDTVLYLAYKDDTLIGYRTIMPDLIFVDGKEMKVAWLSGNWVHCDCRRQGIATLLLDEALKDWGSRLMYTNYALESKFVYDKSDKFEELLTKKGRRFYLRPCLYSLVPNKSPFFKRNSWMLKLADTFLRIFNPMPLYGKTLRLDKEVEFEYLERPDTEISEMFEKVCSSTPTRRSRVELQWILRFPWLVSSPLGDRIGRKYYFSSNPQRFSQSIVKVYKSDLLIGFLFFNLTDVKLSVPYCLFKDEDSDLMARIIMLHAFKYRASMVTIYQSDLIKEIKQKFLFNLFSRKRTQIYFATKEIVSTLTGKFKTFNDGDGDCAFI
ncbi:MAG: GNAT family N-acetyltransferase [Bacteroidales bacterium]|nr:GNAT family N-acetyltransferase [Bacteroidales bacterium]